MRISDWSSDVCSSDLPFAEPPSSDDFSSRKLGLQWQWNHNPDDGKWSLKERPGFLRLHATQADGIWTARNTLTQKAQGPKMRAEIGRASCRERVCPYV